MNPADTSPGNAVHPSPHRGRVSPWAMWFGILGAPVAWSLQQLINPPIFAHGCFPHDLPLGESLWSNVRGVTTMVEVIAVVACAAAGWVSWLNWRRSREEKPGSGHHLIEAGDGRTRFMAMVGLICSGLFLIAVLFATAMPYMVPLCSG